MTGNQVKPFREIHASNLVSRDLREEMDSQGYLLVREAVPPHSLSPLLGEITQILHTAGWLLPGQDPAEHIANASAACGDPDPTFKRVYDEIFSLESFHAFAHHPALQRVMNLLVGQQLLIHPKPIARLIFPHCEQFVVHAHQDHQALAGDPDSFTAWIPLHDCPTELGPLQILEGSHQFGLQNADPATGYIPKETARGGDWVGGPINAGDVLLFHSLTIHAASPNLSSQLRISLDCRFQDYGRPLNPATLVFAGESDGKSWEKVYSSWCSDDLTYFWKKMPLQFNPSKLELEQLTQTADSPRMRARFTRILSQLESQL